LAPQTQKTSLHIGSGTSTGTLDLTSYGGTSNDYALVSSDTATETVSWNLSIADGSRNSRAKFFLTDDVSDSGSWGLWETYGSGGDQPFVIGTGASEHFRINTNGNVGIGTTTPEALLDVHGTLNISRTSTYTSNWAIANTYATAANYGSLYLTPSIATADFVISNSSNDRLFYLVYKHRQRRHRNNESRP